MGRRRRYLLAGVIVLLVCLAAWWFRRAPAATGNTAESPVAAGQTQVARKDPAPSSPVVPEKKEAAEEERDPTISTEPAEVIVTVREALTGNTVDACAIQGPRDFANWFHPDAVQYSAPCDARGVATISTMLRPALLMEISAPGFATTRREVAVDRARVTIDVLLARGGSVRGTVVDASDRPMEGVDVRIKSGPLGQSQKTDQAGRFRADGVAAGPVVVTADKTWARDDGASDAFLSTGFLLGPGETREVTIRFPKPGVISGRVVSRDRRPLPSPLSVKAVGAAHGTTRVDDEGRFVLPALLPGKYTVSSVTADGRAGALTGVEVRAGEEQSVELVLEAAEAQSIDGIVRDSAGHPLAGVQVWADTPEFRAETDARGAFHLAGLRQGKYVVYVFDARPPGSLRSTTLRNVETGTHVEIVMPDFGTVSGLVLDPDGRLATTCTVSLHPEDDSDTVSHWSSALGSRNSKPMDCAFLLHDVPAGRYRITASSPGKAAGVKTVVVEADRETRATIVLGAGARIRGRVVADGRGLAGCLVGLGAITGSDGAFELPGFADGASVLRASCPDGRAGSAAVTVKDGREEEIVIEVAAVQ